MIDPVPPLPWRDLVRFQLCLLDLYDALLDNPGWDEAKVNTILKTFMSSMLALIRVQQSIGGEVRTIQQELIRQYRSRLEMWMETVAENSGDGAPPPGPVEGGVWR